MTNSFANSSSNQCKNIMEDFSGLALPPLFGEHILEAELEPGGVELGPGEVELGPGGNELPDSVTPEDEERRALDKRKYLALSRRCKEIEQVNQKILGRLHQVQRITRRMKKERRCSVFFCFCFTSSELPPVWMSTGLSWSLLPGRTVIISTVSLGPHHPQLCITLLGPKKRRHRIPRQEKDKDQHTEPDISLLAETQFGEMPSPTSLSH
ncbi:hypothetical protein fugu_010180 [Takifugu bimaculatus]|uniref:INO80 complex subunit F domain-containing protein n=1 Tax=Takifugu bimaculatus TaxID=433685 RepID=A0A4Z2CEM3_9TELE|nr:hypothetical protein fugu_010180 [Takifugu bimaculatus]